MRTLGRLVTSQLIIVLLRTPWTFGCKRLQKYPEETWIEVVGGQARANDNIYTPGDCGPIRSGRYTATYLDVGAAIDHATAPGVTIVAGGGYITTTNVSEPRWLTDTLRGTITQKRSVSYFQAKFRLDYDYYGYEIGLVGMLDSLHNQEAFVYPALQFRFGNFESLFGTLGIMRNASYLAGGSIFDLGIGYYFKEIKTRTWLGVGVHPQYTNAQLIAEAECRVANNLCINASANTGSLLENRQVHPLDPPEGGFSLGVRFKIR